MKKSVIALLLAVMLLATACTANPSGQTEATAAPTETAAAPGTEEPIASAAPQRENEERYGGNMNMVTDQISTTMDPHLSNGLKANYDWMMNVFETPITVSNSGEFYPLVCNYELSDDGLTLKLTVREGVTFHNGQAVTIEDVVASIERASALYANLNDGFMALVTETKVEDNSATYTFSTYSPTIMRLISDSNGPCWIIPKSVIDKVGVEGTITDIADVIGTGCYQLSEFTPETKIVVARYDGYVANESEAAGPAAPRRAYLDTITYNVNTDKASTTAGLIAGDYDYGSVITEMAPYAEKVGLKKIYLKNNWAPSIFFNLSDENKDSIVQDVNFRKAVRAALDMNAIMLAVTSDPNRIILDPCVATNESIYYNDIMLKTEWNAANPELAKEYLAACNYNGEKIVWMCAQSASFYTAAVPAVQMLQDVGINVELNVVDTGSHSTLRSDPASGFDIGAWETQKRFDNPVLQASFVKGVAGGWWQNEKRDELVSIMNSTVTGSPESIAAFEEFCTLVAEEVPYIIFGEIVTLRYAVPSLEINYEGNVQFVWNAYFTA